MRSRFLAASPASWNPAFNPTRGSGAVDRCCAVATSAAITAKTSADPITRNLMPISPFTHAEARPIAASCGFRVAIQLHRNGVELIAHRSRVLVLTRSQIVGALHRALHRARTLRLNRVRPRQLIDVRERDDRA